MESAKLRLPLQRDLCCSEILRYLEHVECGAWSSVRCWRSERLRRKVKQVRGCKVMLYTTCLKPLSEILKAHLSEFKCTFAYRAEVHSKGTQELPKPTMFRALRFTVELGSRLLKEARNCVPPCCLWTYGTMYKLLPPEPPFTVFDGMLLFRSGLWPALSLLIGQPAVHFGLLCQPRQDDSRLKIPSGAS